MLVLSCKLAGKPTHGMPEGIRWMSVLQHKHWGSSVAAWSVTVSAKESQMEAFCWNWATSDFIRKVDLAFDLLNSRNPLAKGYKAPVSHQNLSLWRQGCDMLVSYFLQLKDAEGNSFEKIVAKLAFGECFEFASIGDKCSRATDSFRKSRV